MENIYNYNEEQRIRKNLFCIAIEAIVSYFPDRNLNTKKNIKESFPIIYWFYFCQPDG